MRKGLTLILVLLMLTAVISYASAQTAGTPPPVLSDLTTCLSMTRADVTALIGQGEALPFADISDYHESAFELGGFPYSYSALNGALIFYDAAAQDAGAAPYGCLESPGDRVLGIMLNADSLSLNVSGFQAGLSAGSIASLQKEFNVKTEHVNGLYEYYRIRAEIGGILYVWVSDNADMSDSVLYASLILNAGEETH
jgi:hypothetical protein